MRVCEQHREIKGLIFEFGHQRRAERAQAGARVEDDDFVAAAHFHAGRVAAIIRRARPRRGD